MTIDFESQIIEFEAIIEKGRSAYQANQIQIYKDSLVKASSLMRAVMINDNVDLALAMEVFWYNNLVKLEENEENYFLGFKEHKKSFWDAGVKRSNLTNFSPNTNKNSLAFVLSNPVLLGHTEVMLIIIEQWIKKFPQLNIYVAGLNKFQDSLKSRLENLGIQMIESVDQKSLSSSIQKLKEIIQSKNIHTAIWVSIPVNISYIFGVNIAVRQVMWSLKFHPVHLGEKVIHIATSKFNAEKFIFINGYQWLSFTPPLVIKKIPISSEIFNNTMKKFPKKFIFGTLAREEKFNSEKFIATIIAILKKCPNSIYLFSGRTPNQFLVNAAKENGIIDRIYFIGWVDTNLYGALLDVFLESFPFGCGITSIQSISHGTHLVSLWAEDTIARLYFKNTEEALNFKPSWHVAKSTDDYINNAVDLYEKYLKDKALQKNFYTSKHINDDQKAEAFLSLILEH
jgi:hypothetical protein